MIEVQDLILNQQDVGNAQLQDAGAIASHTTLPFLYLFFTKNRFLKPVFRSNTLAINRLAISPNFTWRRVVKALELHFMVQKWCGNGAVLATGGA